MYLCNVCSSGSITGQFYVKKWQPPLNQYNFVPVTEPLRIGTRWPVAPRGSDLISEPNGPVCVLVTRAATCAREARGCAPVPRLFLSIHVKKILSSVFF